MDIQYKEKEPKVGDWIYFLKAFDSRKIGDVRQITSTYPENILGSKGWLNYSGGGTGGGFRMEGNGYYLNKDYRIAQQHEIPIEHRKEIDLLSNFLIF